MIDVDIPLKFKGRIARRYEPVNGMNARAYGDNGQGKSDEDNDDVGEAYDHYDVYGPGRDRFCHRVGAEVHAEWQDFPACRVIRYLLDVTSCADSVRTARTLTGLA